MIDHIGGSADLVDRPEALRGYDHVILPGVGHYDHGMELLNSGGWVPEILAAASRGAQLLGICLGMQLLCDGSEEGTAKGLGLIKGRARRLEPHNGSRIKVPHIGWTVTEPLERSGLFRSAQEELRYYFVHSYAVVCENEKDVLARVDYGGPVVAAIGRGNVRGVQFHPEKSHRFGMTLLGNFIGIEYN